MTKTPTAARVRGAILYTRVSTDEQDKHGTSPETQRDACRAKALALSLPIIAEYHDGGISGGFLLARPGMQAAIADLQAGRADTLICANISRFSRDVEHQQSIKKTVSAAGGRLVFCDMTFDDTPEGDMAFGFMGQFAQYEKAVTRQRTMKGRRKRAEDGQQPSRATSPYGYRIVTKADILRGDYPHTLLGHYQIVEAEAAIVRELFARYAGGESLNALCRWLNADSIPTRGKALYWRPSGLSYILKNTVYRGEAHFGQREHRKTESRLFEINPTTGKPYKQDIVRRDSAPENVVDIDCPALVKAETWDAVNALLPGNQKSGGNPEFVRMLTGKVFCPQCGGRVVSGCGGRNSYVNVRGETLYYPRERRYLCMSSARQRCTVGYHSCTGESYMIKRVEEATVAALLAAAEQPNSLAEVVTAFRAREAAKQAGQPGAGDPARARREKAQVEDALTRLETRQAATVKAQIAGIMAGADAGAYSSVFADIAAERKDLEDRRGQLARTLKAADHRGQQEKGVAAKEPKKEDKEDLAARALALAYDVLTSETVPNAKKRAIIGTLIDKVICQVGGAKVVFLPGVIEAEATGTENPSSADTVQSISIVCTVSRLKSEVTQQKEWMCAWSVNGC